MEAQAAAQKLAAQHVAQAALRGMHPPAGAGSNSGNGQQVSGSMEMEIKEELPDDTIDLEEQNGHNDTIDLEKIKFEPVAS